MDSPADSAEPLDDEPTIDDFDLSGTSTLGLIRQIEGHLDLVAVIEQEEVVRVAGREEVRIAILAQSNQASGTTDVETAGRPQREAGTSETPVAEGEQHEVEIEDTGEQGDGIARVGPGYIVFVPETAIGDRVTVEITQVKESFAFAEVVEDEPIAG